MILATHSLTGAVVGKYVNNTWLIIILSVILHFILDTFRHGEYLNQKSTIKDTFWKVALDIGIGAFFIALITFFSHYNTVAVRNIAIGAFFSMLPDALTFLYWKGGVKFLKKPCEFHARLHKYPPFAPEREWSLKNAANDIMISVIAIIILLL